MTITFVGHGYVGLVSAAVFADLGNTVYVIGHTASKIESLKKGIIPIYEPGIDELVKRNVKAKRLLFTLEYTQAISSSDAVFIAVGTPPKPNGEADLSVVFDVAEKVGKHLKGYTVVVTKSTVPVGTNKRIREIINRVRAASSSFDIASVPEFLREGQAISDTRHPDRVVIGTDTEKAQEVMRELHAPIQATQVITTIETAEMIKYASNAFLATKISFANAIASLSEKVGADGTAVLSGIGLDRRIGSSFLNAGAGYGGSCFPKDVKALIAIAKGYGYDFSLLREVETINKHMMLSIVEKAEKMLHGKVRGKEITVLGLSFKPDTDDMRDAPSLVVIRKLAEKGARVRVFDPIAMENARKILADVSVAFAKDLYSSVKDADATIIVTEWDEFREADLGKIKKLMKTPNVVDGRNIYSPTRMKELGFTYVGVGR
ncbi:MAG: UDP-glucose/GDP-mannose dehydrogenase family protein [bacterium]|nr:UDP-glucose/GDP-mannose dehydrogenase family protein [bacterium]